MDKSPKPSNFAYLDPDAPRTRRIIEAVLNVNVPWHSEQAPVWQPSRIVELADRIDHRAQQGLTVHLRPDTARTVALTLRLFAEGHPQLRDSHPHHVEDWTTEPHQVLCYATNATLAIGAWEHYAPQHPQRNLIATWGGWITRGSKKGRA